MKNIFLCGFMGSGKSTMSKLIKKNTNIKVMDTDLEIEKETNLTISQIFSKFKEPYFRQLETNILKKINKKNNMLISTGGATLIKNNNYKIIQQNSFIIFLDTPFQICLNRIKTSMRPLVKQNSVLQLEKIYYKRKKKFQHIASYTISEPENLSIKIKLNLVLHTIKLIWPNSF